MEIWLANPRGFCAGVERAIEIVERTLAEQGASVYVRHAIVHSEAVVADLERKGSVFVQDTAAIPRGAPAVFSAHGVPPRVEAEARIRGLEVVDATCPLVARVHREARRHAADGCDVVVVGRAGHPEVVGMAGQVEPAAHVVSSTDDVARLEVRDPKRVAYVTQTTLAVDVAEELVAALQARFPRIRGGATRDICHATRSRQAAARELAVRCEPVVVVGSAASSNAAHLRAWFGAEVHEQPGPEERVALPLPRRFASTPLRARA